MGARGYSLSSGVIISLAGSALTTAAPDPQRAKNSHRGSHASHLANGNCKHRTDTGRFYTQTFILAHTDPTSVYMCVWLSYRRLLQACRLSSYLSMSSDFSESWLRGAQVCPCASPFHQITAVAGQQRLLYCCELRNKSYTNMLIVLC